jgi:hypothetical protein
MNMLVILAGLGGFTFVMWDFCQRLPPEQAPRLWRWYGNWAIKGLLTPFLIWMLFNSEVWNWLPPLMSTVGYARNRGEWLAMMGSVATLGLFVIGTYWSAVTAAWLLVVLWRQAAETGRFRNCVLSWSLILGPMAALMTWFFGWRLAGLGTTLWLLPVLQRVLALQPDRTPAPLYSRAIAAIHFDKYEEAEKAVIQELESHEDDFDGWLLLAELYACNFNDLPGARELIRETCEHPGTTPSQFAVACHRLADWQLKLGDDPDAARATLTEICRRFPKSHLDRMARLRIQRLPANREEWIALHGVKKIRLPSLGGVAPAGMSRQEAVVRSQQCVQQLQTNPDDVAAREELARLWAVELGQVEMGAEQLELLLAMPGTAPAKAAEWLGLLASWHLRVPLNPSAARAALERLVRLYPHSPQAFAAQRRLNLMDIEAKMRQERRE